VRRLGEEDLASLGSSARMFRNLNDPSDYDAARADNP
jgi:hypothetical protein